MGYNYHIVLEEKENENWKEIYRYSNSGSFSSSDNHYFLSELNYSIYLGKDSEDYQWYLFKPEEVLEEYNKYDRGDWKLRMNWIIDSSNTVEEAIEKIKDFEFEVYLPSYWKELEDWVVLIQQNPGKELRIRYGYSV
jgi:hypothetical protein